MCDLLGVLGNLRLLIGAEQEEPLLKQKQNNKQNTPRKYFQILLEASLNTWIRWPCCHVAVEARGMEAQLRAEPCWRSRSVRLLPGGSQPWRLGLRPPLLTLQLLSPGCGRAAQPFSQGSWNVFAAPRGSHGAPGSCWSEEGSWAQFPVRAMEICPCLLSARPLPGNFQEGSSNMEFRSKGLWKSSLSPMQSAVINISPEPMRQMDKSSKTMLRGTTPRHHGSVSTTPNIQ